MARQYRYPRAVAAHPVAGTAETRRALALPALSRKTVALVLILVATAVIRADVRRDIIIVGSSTVYPFSSFVAEYFGLSSPYSSARVESTGTGGGFKFFCQGVGLAYPDINNASRAIKNSEIELCRKNGVRRILELTIGRDSIVLVVRRGSRPHSMSIAQIYQALARWLPDPVSGVMTDNPHRYYSDISPSLPKYPIRVLGPPPTSGTRDSFVELVMEKACLAQPVIAELKKSDVRAYAKYCRTVREDGAYIEAGENDNLILRKVADGEQGTLGITGFNFYIQNRDTVSAVTIDGISPTRASVMAGRYPVSRPLFIYVKSEHIDMIPGLEEFIDLFLSDFITGAQGQLGDLGLITPGKKLLDSMRENWQLEKQKVLKLSGGRQPQQPQQPQQP
ncbi:MAG: substrate-binding domain-containing protein [Proteobacteria bacterium]|nr:substrate-binding domain-containing protein [Pseudomonadota bacterium]